MTRELIKKKMGRDDIDVPIDFIDARPDLK
jgi:hypothetical protein